MGEGEEGQNERVAFNRIHYHVQNWIAGGNVLYDTGRSGLLPCDDNLEGSDLGKVGGRGHLYPCD